jgi:methionyl aminopeptidase
MTFVDATQTSRRRPGEIKLFGEEGFAGMRKAGRLAAVGLGASGLSIYVGN